LEEHPDEPLNVGPRSPGLTLAQIQAQQQQQVHHNHQHHHQQQQQHQQQHQQQQQQQVQLQLNQPQSQSQSPIKFENKLTLDQERLAELREKPLTLHNMKSAVATSAKTEALIASLGLKPNSIDFKQKLSKNKLITKKPLKKRLKDLQPLGGQALKDIKAAKLLAKYQKQQSNDSIKKISKATLKNNQLILSSINARKQIEERQNSQIQDVHNKFLFKKCRYFKCSECKLIFVDSLQLHHHQSHSINCSKQIKVVHDDNPTKLANLSAFIDQQKRFQCSFCKNIYLNKFSFLSHVLTCNVVNNLL
jgi:hypothetical protein